MTRQQILDDFNSVALLVTQEYEKIPSKYSNKIDKLWLNSCYKALALNAHRPGQTQLDNAVLITDVWDFVSVIDRPLYEHENHPFYQAWDYLTNGHRNPSGATRG